MPFFFKIIRDGENFSCSADGGSAFFVGRRVEYEGNIGLFNIYRGTKLPKLNFEAADYLAEFGFWARFIEPTALCEGRNFLTLNTYDRARFTFGFGQFAAHVPNGDFVSYFRAVLAQPEASEYFPHLAVIKGRICKTDGPQPRPLENDDSTTELMNYLNPDLEEVQDAEVISSAKFIHFTQRSAVARKLQVVQMIDAYRGFMRTASKRLPIDGSLAQECCVVADVLHHGRGGKTVWPRLHEAMLTNKPFDTLIGIGHPKWDERKKTLRSAILARDEFQSFRWDSSASDFVQSP